MSDDIHDEIAHNKHQSLGEHERAQWRRWEGTKLRFEVPDDPVAQAHAVVGAVEDVEKLLYRMWNVPECKEWIMRREEWLWPTSHDYMDPDPAVWLLVREQGGARFVQMAKDVLTKPAWMQHVDEITRSAHQLLREEPEVICMACSWLTTVYPTESPWLQNLQKRISWVDKRLTLGHDWLFDASMMFGTIARELEEAAKEKLKVAKSDIELAEELLEKLANKPKIV